MFPARRVVSYIAAEPFRPFRVTLVSGRSFDIRHPEMVALSRSSLFIFLYLGDQPDEPREREVEVSLLLIESIEPFEVATRPNP